MIFVVLNPDCVRDILLAVEFCSFGEVLTLDSLMQKLPDYTEEELWYTSLKLQEGGYLNLTAIPVCRQRMPAIKSINDLTFAGHEFLNNVRKETIWDKTKSIAGKAGAFSIAALCDIAQDVVKTAITSALLPN